MTKKLQKGLLEILREESGVILRSILPEIPLLLLKFSCTLRRGNRRDGAAYSRLLHETVVEIGSYYVNSLPTYAHDPCDGNPFTEQSAGRD